VNKRVSVEQITPLRPGHGRVDDALDAVVPARPEHPWPANDTGADPNNIVPFMRPRGGRTAPAVALPTDAARLPRAGLPRERAQLAAFLVASLALHTGLLTALWREPPPLASIGLEVMSVEIVVGATAPAGVAPTEGEQQNNSAAEPETQVTEAEKADAKATRQEQTVEVARQETAPEQKTEQPKAAEAKPEEPKKVETTPALQEPAPAEQKPAVAMVETPTPDTATAKPQETAPAPTEVTLLPQPEEKPVEKKVERKPVQAAPPKPVKDAKPAKEPRRIAAPTRENAAREAKASVPSTAANNVGIGRSDNSSNYPGLVSAHLRRYQQYPSDARSRGDQGTATVSFSLDGGGRVTSARLARASGIPGIDQEVQAMVRRASPFPAPPGGRAQSFTVPVSFRLN
jgi:protein TonB